MFERLGKICPALEEFQRLLPGPRLQDTLCEFYAYVVDFCKDTVELFHSKSLFSTHSISKQISLRLFLALPKLTFSCLKNQEITQLWTGTWRSFNNQFEIVRQKLELQYSYVELEIRLASEQAKQAEAAKAAVYRAEGAKHQSFEVEEWKKATWWRLQQNSRQKGLCDLSVRFLTNFQISNARFYCYGCLASIIMNFFRGLQTGDSMAQAIGFSLQHSTTNGSLPLLCYGVMEYVSSSYFISIVSNN